MTSKSKSRFEKSAKDSDTNEEEIVEPVEKSEEDQTSVQEEAPPISKDKTSEKATELTPEEIRNAKIVTIRASKMPEDQKEEYIASLLPNVKEDPKAVSLDIFARIRGIGVVQLDAMRHWPAAKGMRTATVDEWDQIFQGF